MANTVIIPPGNPFHFVPVDDSRPARYHSGHLETNWQIDLIERYEDQYLYLQPAERADRLRFMFHATDHIGRSLHLLNAAGKVVSDITSFKTVDIAGNLDQDGDQLHTYLYRATDYSAAAVDGAYFLLLTVQFDSTHTKQYICEPLQVQDKHEGTILMEYNHSSNKGGLYFEQLPAIYPFRVPAALAEYNSATYDTLYNDQNEAPVLLDSTSVDTWQLSVGQAETGICDWVLKRLGIIMGFDRVLYDGRQYVRGSGSKWTITTGRPLFGATTDLLDADNGSDGNYPDARRLIYTAPAYPYVVETVYIGALRILAAPVVIDNSTEETALVTALNASVSDLDLLGSVSKSGSAISYINGPGENYSASALLLTTFFGFNWNSPGSGGFGPILAFTISNGDIVVDWGDGNTERFTATRPRQCAHLYGATPGAMAVRIFGRMAAFTMDTAYRTTLYGTLPAGMQSLIIQSGSFPSNSFAFSILAPLQSTLRTLSITNAGLTAASGANGYSFPLLKNENFSGNNFSGAVISAFMYDVLLNTSNNNLSGGIFSIVQSPSPVLTSAGNYNKSQLTGVWGWTVNN